MTWGWGRDKANERGLCNEEYADNSWNGVVDDELRILYSTSCEYRKRRISEGKESRLDMTQSTSCSSFARRGAVCHQDFFGRGAKTRLHPDVTARCRIAYFITLVMNRH